MCVYIDILNLGDKLWPKQRHVNQWREWLLGIHYDGSGFKNNLAYQVDLRIEFLNTFREIGLWYMPQKPIDSK